MALSCKKLIPVALVGLLSIPSVLAFTHVTWSEEMYDYVRNTYGTTAEKRFREWHIVIEDAEQEEELARLRQVNDFFNRVQWVSDTLHWGKKDYWQTPLETLTTFKGDCEDIAIAKYTTLRIMGYDEESVNLVYSLVGDTPHMVLAYYHDSSEHPYILDSFDKRLLTSLERPDLTSIFEFNSSTVWLADQHFEKARQSFPEHMAKLDELKERVVDNRHLLMAHNDGKPVVPFALDTL